jgi:hypothetical protein
MAVAALLVTHPATPLEAASPETLPLDNFLNGHGNGNGNGNSGNFNGNNNTGNFNGNDNCSDFNGNDFASDFNGNHVGSGSGMLPQMPPPHMFNDQGETDCQPSSDEE